MQWHWHIVSKTWDYENNFANYDILPHEIHLRTYLFINTFNFLSMVGRNRGSKAPRTEATLAPQRLYFTQLMVQNDAYSLCNWLSYYLNTCIEIIVICCGNNNKKIIAECQKITFCTWTRFKYFVFNTNWSNFTIILYNFNYLNKKIISTYRTSACHISVFQYCFGQVNNYSLNIRAADPTIALRVCRVAKYIL